MYTTFHFPNGSSFHVTATNWRQDIAEIADRRKINPLACLRYFHAKLNKSLKVPKVVNCCTIS